MNQVPSTYQPLWEARQEAMDDGNASPPTNYIERMEKLHGPATGEILEGDIF